MISNSAFCENAGHRDSISFVFNVEFIASSATFDSLSLLNFGWVFCALVIEFDAIVFISSSYQIFLKLGIRIVSLLNGPYFRASRTKSVIQSSIETVDKYFLDKVYKSAYGPVFY